ncbi:MAG TPA: hypothetical protein VGM56_12675 [Byssovorax sp.]
MTLAVVASLGALACCAVVYASARVFVERPSLAPVDVPDARRLHTRPTPRAGGIALPFVVSLACAALLVTGNGGASAGTLAIAVLAFALPNGVLGAIDDYRPLRSRVKFGLQIAFAAAFVVVGPRVTELAVPPLLHVALGPLAAPFTALFLVWSTNVFNFMDGMDALAAGSGVVFFAALAALALLFVPGGAPIAAVCAAAGAGLVGFLALNRPPARIFMGDGGALFVGALLGVVSVLVASSPAGAAPTVPFASVALAVGPFLWDATYTLFFRIARREDWLHPHRRHLFQRLALSGATHGRVRVIYFALAVGAAAAAVALPSLAPWAAGCVITIALAAFSALSIAAGRAERAAATQGSSS